MPEYPTVHDNEVSLLKKIATNTTEISGVGGGGGGSGSDTTYDPSDSGLTATDVQEAIDEAVALINERIESIEDSVTDGQVIVFNGASGKSGKKATGTGIAKLDNGVLGVATIGSGLDYTGGTLSATGSSGSKTLCRWRCDEGIPPTSNFATFNVRNARPVMEFDDTTDESLLFIGMIPEGANLSSGITVRTVWKGKTATSGNLVITSAFERGNTDSDADSFATGVDSAATAVSGTSGISVTISTTHSSSEIDGVTVGDVVILKITRKASSGSDTVVGDAQLEYVEIRQAA
jgi:hypothetical protein